MPMACKVEVAGELPEDVVSFALSVAEEALGRLRGLTSDWTGGIMTQVAEDTRWITRREAARLAGVHYNTIKLWESSGRLHPRRVTVENVEEVRLDLGELQAVIAQRQKTDEPEERPTVPESQLWEAYEASTARIIELERNKAGLEARNELLQSELDRARGEYERLMSILVTGYKPDDQG